jgi:hypothetical protein
MLGLEIMSLFLLGLLGAALPAAGSGDDDDEDKSKDDGADPDAPAPAAEEAETEGEGASLLDYAERIKWAHQTLGLKTFVVLMEHMDASQTLCDSGNVHARCLSVGTLEPIFSRRPPSGPLKNLLRESALAQYLNSQLKFSPSRLTSPDFWSSGAPPEPEAPPRVATPMDQPPLSRELRSTADAALGAFFEQVSTLEDLRVVLVIDMNRRNLETGVRAPDESYHLAERLRERNQVVVLGEPLYREHLRQSPLRIDVGPYDQHFNRLGVALLMNAAAQALQYSINAKEN